MVNSEMQLNGAGKKASSEKNQAEERPGKTAASKQRNPLFNLLLSK